VPPRGGKGKRNSGKGREGSEGKRKEDRV